MGWGTVALLLVGCAAFGALLGTAPRRVPTWVLVVVALLAASFAFLPGTCVTAIAAAPTGEQLQQGWSSCQTLYGAAVPEGGRLDAELTGRLLHLTAAVLAVTALLLVRRARRRSVMPDQDDQGRPVR